jgi:GNAT superfamily N-acetyltransferase
VAGVSDLVVRPTRYGAPVSTALIAAAQADLGERYGGDGDSTPVSALQFDPPGGGFFVVRAGDEPVGCGGWRTYHVENAIGEVKRMYTVPAWRGRGVAMIALRAIEDAARTAGMRRMILETGLRQPEAIALYERVGYARIENFGHYKDSELSVSFGRDL